MASVSMAMPMTTAVSGQKGVLSREASSPFAPLQMKPRLTTQKKPTNNRLKVTASLREKAVTAATAAALTASMVVPQVAEAADLTPSLKNFLLSIAAGGVVLAALGGAVIGVSYFDPVKRT